MNSSNCLRTRNCILSLFALLSALTIRPAALAQTAPVFTGISTLPDGRGLLTLNVATNVEHSFLTSTNLRNWNTAFLFQSTSTVYAVTTPAPLLAMGPNMFFRAATGRILNFDLSLHFSLSPGTFNTGFTPAVAYPVTIDTYSANLNVDWETNPPPLAQVLFTGPAGSGLVNSLASDRYDWSDGEGCTFASQNVTSPRVPPPGVWLVVYRGVTNTFTQAAFPTNLSVAIPVPTVTVDAGLLYRVDWTYRNPTNGALMSTPDYLLEVEIQVDGPGWTRIYNSDELPPDTTSHVLTDLVEWDEVINITIACTDLDGRHFVLFYHKP